MSTSLDHLLPPADEAPRCAPHARGIGVDPGGSGIRADLVILVETPLPWPKPALDHPLPAALLAGFRSGSGPAPPPVRVLAVVPVWERPGIGVSVYARRGGGASLTRYRVPDAVALRALGRTLSGRSAVEAPDPAHLVEHHEVAPPALLVCTQGSHDVCCGSEGARLVTGIERSGPAVEIHRVSHTGGHRFAPTAMTLPDGRMWAGLTPALVAAVVERSGPPPLGAHRGWWGADPGPAQVAEAAVLGLVGWAFDEVERVVTTAPVGADGDGAVVGCTVDAAARRWTVTVAEGRLVPTIACRQPGGLPAKSAREYDVLGVAEVGVAGRPG